MSFRNCDSAANQVDPVVASLTSNQRRQVVKTYGGGQGQLGGEWEPLPNLTPEQIKRVLAEEKWKTTCESPQRTHLSSPYDCKAFRATDPPQPYTVSTGHGGIQGPKHQHGYQDPSHHPSTTRNVYPPVASYRQFDSRPPESYPSPKSAHPPSSSAYHASTLTSNIFSIGSAENWSVGTDSNDYAIMIIGVTGSGKSTACNFFLNKKVFNTKGGGAVSVTAKSDAHSGTVFGKKFLFIDTPGFSDAYESEEQRMADLGRALYFAQDGVHAIAICFNGQARFDVATEGVVNALDQLGTFWPHAFILYTHADGMGSTESEQKQEIYQWLNNPRCPDRLKWLLQQVQHRFMTVESRMRGDDSAYHQQKCQELLECVEHVYTQNNRQLYTNKLFKWAKEQYDQARQDKMKQEEELKRCKESLTDQQESLRTFEEQSMRETRSQQQTIDNLQKEIQSLQQQQQQAHSSREQDDLYQRLLQKQATEQEENRKLNSIIKEQRETLDQIRQVHSQQLREESRLQQLQNQSVMEVYMERMQEDMQDIKAENVRLKDRLFYTEKQVQCQNKADDDDNNADSLVMTKVKGVTEGAKNIIDKAAKHVVDKCCVM